MTRWRVQWMRARTLGRDVPERYRRADFATETDALRFEAHLLERRRVAMVGKRAMVCVFAVTTSPVGFAPAPRLPIREPGRDLT
jgi:hypothetical protein